jgi:pyrimidine-nucleoside phosphorylase
MLRLAGKADTLEEARQLALSARDSGRALEKFRAMVAAQGGKAELVDKPEQFPRASLVKGVHSPRSGFIAGVDAMAIGWSCVRLGGGRQKKGEPIDHAVGMLVPVKVGDHITEGDEIGVIHANDQSELQGAHQDLLEAITWSEEPVQPLPHFYQ